MLLLWLTTLQYSVAPSTGDLTLQYAEGRTINCVEITLFEAFSLWWQHEDFVLKTQLVIGPSNNRYWIAFTLLPYETDKGLTVILHVCVLTKHTDYL